MSEATIPLPNDAREVPIEAHPLSIGVEVNGLSYVLEGQIPGQPDKFELVASLPEQVWAEMKPQVEKELSENSWFARQYRSIQQTLRLGDGRVGSVWVSPHESSDGEPTIHIDRIQTELGYIPKGNKYYDAKGVGSAILDSLCDTADSAGWRITLYPLERDGRLMGTDLQDWYRRRGFKFKFEEENSELKALYPTYDMLRFPQPPDLSLPIAQVFAHSVIK